MGKSKCRLETVETAQAGAGSPRHVLLQGPCVTPEQSAPHRSVLSNWVTASPIEAANAACPLDLRQHGGLQRELAGSTHLSSCSAFLRSIT